MGILIYLFSHMFFKKHSFYTNSLPVRRCQSRHASHPIQTLTTLSCWSAARVWQISTNWYILIVQLNILPTQ